MVKRGRKPSTVKDVATKKEAQELLDEIKSIGIKEVKENKEIKSQPLALFALLAAVIALAISFIKKRFIALVNIVISVCGGILLLLLKFSLDSDAELNGQNIIQLEYQFAYWLSIILFIGAAVVQWKIYSDDGAVKANVLS